MRFKAGGYAHARQYKRLKRVLKRQRTIVGRLIREVRVKMGAETDLTQASNATPIVVANITTTTKPNTTEPAPLSAHTKPSILLARAERIRSRQPKDKNKLYALHAPEVECISKGKACNWYEFGVKVSPAITHRQGLMVGAKRFTGNPFDGHTLKAQLAQSNALIQSAGTSIKQAFVDLAYRGVDADNPGVEVIHRGASSR